MKKVRTQTKRALSVLLAVVMVVLAVPVAFASTYSGSCGNNVTFTLDLDSGLLQLKGYGKINSHPWTGSSSYYSKIKKVTIQSGITHLADSSFNWCSNLESVTIPTTVQSFGNRVFDGCSSLKSVTIPSGVTIIPYQAFSGCSSLTSISIPNTVESIELSAFYGCSRATTITIPNSVTYIGERAFAGCSSVTTISIPDSVTTLGTSAFSDCSDLQTVKVGNGITTLSNGVFQNCIDLKTVTLPSSLKKIGEYTFAGCKSLQTISIPEGLETFGVGVFGSCSSLKNIYLPKSLKGFSGASYSSTLPFDGCNLLKDIYYAGSKEDWAQVSYNYYIPSTATVHFNSTDPSIHTHSYTSSITTQPSCGVPGVRTYRCSCGNSYTETIPALTHTDNNKDGKCDYCGYQMTTQPEVEKNYTATHGWCIPHDRKAFGYPDKYSYPIKRYFEVYGYNIMPLIKGGIEKITGYKGCCFGLSLLSAAQYYGKINLSSYFSKTGKTLYDFGYEKVSKTADGKDYFSLQGNQAVIDLIERAMVTQDSVEFKQCEIFKDDSNYSKLLSFMSGSSARPLLVSFIAGITGHTMLLTDDFVPYELNDQPGWYCIAAYDTNSVFNNGLLNNPTEHYKRGRSYMLVNPSTGEWSYYANNTYQFGSSYYGFPSLKAPRSFWVYDVSLLKSSFFTKALNLYYKHFQIKIDGFEDCTIADENNNVLMVINDGILKHIDSSCEYVPTFYEANNSSSGGGTFYSDNHDKLRVYFDKGEALGISKNHALFSKSENSYSALFDFSAGQLAAKDTSASNETIIAVQDSINNQAVKATVQNQSIASVSLGGNQATIHSDKNSVAIEWENIARDKISFSNQDLPDMPNQPGETDPNACPYCGEVHEGFFGKIVAFFHNILFRIKSLFVKK